MKKFLCSILCAAVLLSLLPACRPSDAGPEPTPPSESEPAEPLPCLSVLFGVWGGSIPGNVEIYATYDPDDMEQTISYIEGAYGLAEGEWEDACVARETGMSAMETAVLRFADEAGAIRGESLLKDYLHSREGDFTGYAPAQAELAADGVVRREGLYVGLFIHTEGDRFEQTFAEIVQTGVVPEPPPEPSMEPTEDPAELLETLLGFCETQGIVDDASGLERVDGGDPDRLKAILENEYKLADYPVEEAAIARGTGGSVFEIAVLRVEAGQAATDGFHICSALTTDYLDAKEAEYARFPAQAGLLGQAMAIHPHGTDFVLLLVCEDAEQAALLGTGLLGANGFESAQRHFNALKPAGDSDPDYPGRTRFVDPGKEDMSIYDTSAIRAAWAEGDPAGLSEKDRAVYDAAREILDEIIRDGMTDLEKETAIYRWLVNNVNYDYTHQDILAQTPRVSYEPYGGLVERSAVCLGYATSFQLLMDLAGVECITVVGACFNSEEHHGWNMVLLDGEWYCVDVTWDANGREQLGGGYEWRYFNVTSDEMARNHQWDYANTPEATAEF